MKRTLFLAIAFAFAPALAAELCETTPVEQLDSALRDLDVCSYMNDACRENQFHGNRCGMSRIEASALFYYTGGGYFQINRDLRFKSPKVRTIARKISSALNKLPDYVGFVNRKSRLPDDVLSQHAEGAVVQYDAFTSASTVPLNWGANTRMVIYSKHGKFIAPFSRNFSESEVLFKPGTRFKVIKRETEVDGDSYTSLLIMKEVDLTQTTAQDIAEDRALMRMLEPYKKEVKIQVPWNCTQNAPLSRSKKRPITQTLQTEITR